MLDRLLANAQVGQKMAEEKTGVSFDDRAQTSANNVVSLVVALLVGALVAAFLIPIAVEAIADAELGANVSPEAESLWETLDIIIILVVFLFFVGLAMAATRKAK